MHLSKMFFDRQYGKCKVNTIEPFLPRLRCLKQDDYSQIYSAQSQQTETPIFACKFSETKGQEHLLALANEDGKIAVHNVLNNERNGFHAHNNAIFDLTWLFQRLKIVTASGDHSSKLYNVSNCTITEERTFFKHERSVKCIAPSRDDPSVFSTGGRDGNIILWDIRADNSHTTIIGKSDKIIHSSHVLKQPLTPRSKKAMITSRLNNSVTGLVFQDSNTLISCGAGDGSIKVWDLRKTHNYKKESLPKFTLPYPGKSTKNGYSNLILDSSCLKLYANCLDSNIYCFNVGTYDTNPVMTYRGHQNQSFYIKSMLSYDDSFLISGSSDENAYIWNLKYSEPICRLTGHTAEVTCVAWRQNVEACIVTCSDDIKHKIWRIGTEELPENTQIEVKGSTEILPMFNVDNVKSCKKRHYDWKICKQIPKKFILSCERCLLNTQEKFCDNCNYSNDKRKSFEEHRGFKKLNTEFGPRKLFASLDNSNLKRKREDENPVFSPLKNLPNFIVDGVAPHLNFSPPKKKHCDWLTRMRIDQSFKRRMSEIADTQVSPKISRTDVSSLKHRPSKQSPLLKYFKMTNNSLKCDINLSILKNCSECNDTTEINN